MLTTAFLLAILTGIAALLPAPAGPRMHWIGLRFFQASMGVIVALYLGNVVFRLPLSTMALLLGAVSSVGIAQAVWRARFNRREFLLAALHPIWIFAALVGLMAALRDGIDYLPFTGDEVSSWLRLARQIYLADDYWSDRTVYSHPGYTNGWPLLVAFVNVPAGRWDDGNAALVPFLLHLGLCGLLFDILRQAAAEALAPYRSGNTWATLFAWLGMLTLLAVEASWLLIPRFLLIDEPLLYAFLGIFLTAIVGLRHGRGRTCVAAYLGLTLAAGYLLKISMFAAVPALGIILIAYARDEPHPLRAGIRYASLIFVPLILASLSWSRSTTGVECNASPISLLGLDGGLSTDQLSYIGQLYAKAATDYLLSYKVPATIGALCCIATAVFRRRGLWIVASVAVFIVGYSTALYLSYFSCIEIVDDELLSFPRYFLVNLRILHVVGPIIFALTAFEMDRTRSLAQSIIACDWARPLAITALGVLFGLQIWQAERSLTDLATRQHQEATNAALVTKMKSESAALRAEIEKFGLDDPHISIVAQGGYGVEIDFGNYFGIKSKPDAGSNFLYTILPPYSWGARTTSFTSEISGKEALVAWWRGFDIIWPIQLDEFTRSAIADIVDDDDCRRQPTRYFLVKVSPKAFRCVAKVN